MKKAVLIFAMVSLLVLSAFGASAANYYPTQDAAENYSYTVTCALSTIADDAAAIVNGESMYGLVAVLGTGEDADITSATSYVYLDQATVDAEGVVEFAGFLPMGVNPDDESFEECTLFIGGPGFDTAKELGVLKKVPDGFAVSGTVTDGVTVATSTKVTTVTVYDAAGTQVGEPATTAADGTYSMVVPMGEGYSVKFTKPGFLTYTYTGVNVAADLTDVNVTITGLAGDIDGNGEIKVADLSALLKDYHGTVAGGLTSPNADVDGNGEVKVADLSALLKDYHGTNVTEAYTASN